MTLRSAPCSPIPSCRPTPSPEPFSTTISMHSQNSCRNSGDLSIRPRPPDAELGESRHCLATVQRGSAHPPGLELLGVAYCPDVLDPVACDLEREHGHGDAVLLGDQPGLAVDRTLQDRHVAGCSVGDFDPGAGDLLAAFDRAQEGKGEAAAVG